MPGPKNREAINRDSYDGTAPPLPPVAVKQINPADKKTGSPAPGVAAGSTINRDTFYE